TTDKITTIDPAGEYDNGSFAVLNQVYPFLLNTPYGSPDVQPDIAASASFTDPNTYTVKLKPDLKFANGDSLTSTDVKFSFDRVITIGQNGNDQGNGPSSLLGNLASVDAPDPLTVVFHLKAANDQTFPQVLSSPAGPIVDHKVFPADTLLPDDQIVKAEPFAGPYEISSYQINQLISYKANPNYQGIYGTPKTPNIIVNYYADASNLKLAVQQGEVDVAYRSLAATDIASLRTDPNLQVVDGPGGEIRYMVFNFDTMPYGAKTSNADPAKALAVRQAVADLIDRQAIADQVYKNTYTPLYSYVPDGLTGANTALKDLYGDGNGGPSTSKATSTLQAAGVTTPVTLNIQYSPDHYGPSSADEYALIKDQLQQSGLFTVNLQSTEWTQYSKDRVNDVYPVYQLGWFPDYSDADNYLTPFFSWDPTVTNQDGTKGNSGFLANHFPSQGQITNDILTQATTADATARAQMIGQVQNELAAQLPTIPYLQGAQVAVVGKNVQGTQQTLDASFKFRYGALYKTQG
ncbi:MAG: ABC transporter substrate-binding protein, partial [Micrococcales bacterium]|nr:ABC transporter substrate-binding protein [Micrococcales bacterium]